MKFSIIKQKFDLLDNGERLTYPDWECNEYIFVNDKDELVTQNGEKFSFDFLDSDDFINDLYVFNEKNKSLKDALAHFASTGRGFRRCFETTDIKTWAKTTTGGLQASLRYTEISVLFTEDDLSAKDYELL